MAANGEDNGNGNSNTVDVVIVGRESARQTTAKERSHSPWQRGADADIVSKQKGVSGSGLGGDTFPVNDLYIPRRPAEEKAQLHQDLCESKRTARIGIDDASLSMVIENTAKMRSWLNRYVLEKEVRLRQESARQTMAKERSHSPWQRGADADILSKQKGVSSSGLGGDMFPVNDLYIPRRPAEEKAQLHQDLCESKRTARIGIDDASLSMVMENTAKMRSWLNRYVLEKEVQLRQESARQTTAKERFHSPRQRGADADILSRQKGVSGSGLGGDMFPVNDLYIPRTPAEEKQLHQDLCESKRTARIGRDDASLSMVMENTAKMRSWLNCYVLEKEVRLRQESVGQITNRERSRSPYQRDADADILWQQKRQITTMERSPYQRDADADIEWQQKRQITTMERSRSPHQRDADADIAWKQKWALYETQRTTRKHVDDAGPSRFVQDAEEEYSCSLRCLAEKEAELKQALLKLARTITEALYETQRTTRKQVDNAGPSRFVQGADEEYSCSLHCLAEKEAELQQALLKLARTITEVRGSFGPLRAVNDAVEAVYAMSMHLVQDKQTINDSSTLQLSTQRELVPARPTTSQAPG